MNFKQHSLLVVAAVAGGLSIAAPAQDYRNQNADDAARQNAPLPSQSMQQVVPPPPACATCGTIDSIRTVEKPGEASGVGLVAGGVLGGLIGHQVGQGRGNTAATIVGAAGGAYAGHQVEKNVKKAIRYDIGVRMNDGTLRTVSYDVEPGFRTGDRVRLVEGRLIRD